MTSSNETEAGYELNEDDRIVLVILYICITICGTVGNLSIVLAVLRHKYLRKRQQLILLNLVFSDLFTICVSAPYYIYSVTAINLKRTELASKLCKSYIYFIYTLGFISILSMLFISLDRYSAIVYPYFYKKHITEKKIVLASGFCWIVPSLFCLSATIIPDWIDFDGRPGGLCGVQWSNVPASYVCIVIGLLFILPTIIIFFTNIRVFVIARKQKRLLRKQSEEIGKLNFNQVVIIANPSESDASVRSGIDESDVPSRSGIDESDVPTRPRTSECDVPATSAMKRLRRTLTNISIPRSVTAGDIQIVSATLFLIVFYLLSWLPFVIPRILHTFKIYVPDQLISYTPAFAFSSVVWDPVLVLWCRNEIRKGVKEVLHQMTAYIRAYMKKSPKVENLDH